MQNCVWMQDCGKQLNYYHILSLNYGFTATEQKICDAFNEYFIFIRSHLKMSFIIITLLSLQINHPVLIKASSCEILNLELPLMHPLECQC